MLYKFFNSGIALYYAMWQLPRWPPPTYILTSLYSPDVFRRCNSSSQSFLPTSINFYSLFLLFSSFSRTLPPFQSPFFLEWKFRHRNPLRVTYLCLMTWSGPLVLTFWTSITICTMYSTRRWIKSWIPTTLLATSTEHTAARWTSRSATICNNMRAVW